MHGPLLAHGSRYKLHQAGEMQYGPCSATGTYPTLNRQGYHGRVSSKALHGSGLQLPVPVRYDLNSHGGTCCSDQQVHHPYMALLLPCGRYYYVQHACNLTCSTTRQGSAGSPRRPHIPSGQSCGCAVPPPLPRLLSPSPTHTTYTALVLQQRTARPLQPHAHTRPASVQRSLKQHALLGPPHAYTVPPVPSLASKPVTTTLELIFRELYTQCAGSSEQSSAAIQQGRINHHAPPRAKNRSTNVHAVAPANSQAQAENETWGGLAAGQGTGNQEQPSAGPKSEIWPPVMEGQEGR